MKRQDRIYKAATTPGEFEKGFINALGVAAEELGLAQRDFVAQIDIIVHGSTVSTNALVERKTAAPDSSSITGTPTS